MLPVSLFAPSDPSTEVEEVRRTRGAHGVVDLLVVTLTDARVRSDADIDEQLDALKAACRQTRRYREAIPVLERIAVLNPSRKHEVAAELALVHTHLGELSKAAAMLDTAVAEHERLPLSKRSLAFSLVAEVAAMLLRRPAVAQRCAEIGRSTASAPAARSRRSATSTRAQRSAATSRADHTTRPERAATPRRRAGLARPVLAVQPMLGEVATEPAPSGRPLLTLIAGSAA